MILVNSLKKQLPKSLNQDRKSWIGKVALEINQLLANKDIKGATIYEKMLP
jgi:hypothetical protein